MGASFGHPFDTQYFTESLLRADRAAEADIGIRIRRSIIQIRREDPIVVILIPIAAATNGLESFARRDLARCLIQILSKVGHLRLARKNLPSRKRLSDLSDFGGLGRPFGEATKLFCVTPPIASKNTISRMAYDET